MPPTLTFFKCASCAPCDQQAAILDHVKREAPGNVEFNQVPTRETEQMARYRVTAHPTIILERTGMELRRWSSVVGRMELLAALREATGPAQPIVPPVEVPSGPVTGMLPGREQARAMPMESPPVPEPDGPRPPGM